MVRKNFLLFWVLAALIACSPELGGRWEVSVRGMASKGGVLELQIGQDAASVAVSGGEDAAAVRDRLTAQLRGLGYSVDCLWSSPSRAIATENGTPVPTGKEYHFVVSDFPTAPEARQWPEGMGLGLRGPRPSVQRETEIVERVAVRWMEAVKEDFQLPSPRSSVIAGLDSELAALLEGLRAKGQPLTFGDIDRIDVQCNQAAVRLVDGLFEAIVVETDDDVWRVTGAQVAK